MRNGSFHILWYFGEALYTRCMGMIGATEGGGRARTYTTMGSYRVQRGNTLLGPHAVISRAEREICIGGGYL